MLDGWTVAAIALSYIGFLFTVASYGDRAQIRRRSARWRPLIYALTLAIYCTSWTFFGSVGLAAQSGFDFLAIYVGPIIVIGLCWRLMRRIVRLSKSQNITSIADFLSARYGKSLRLAAVVTVIAVIGIIPYIALQLKAVADSVTVLIGPDKAAASLPLVPDLALIVAIAMAAFAMLFGTRHIEATEHQEGLMLAVAAESVIKLLAFLAVGVFVTFWMAGGISGLGHFLQTTPDAAALFAAPSDSARLTILVLLSIGAIVLLPRQFHVAVVENVDPDDTRRAAWLFPVYLVLINLFVVPIAIVGLGTLPSSVAPDMYVLALPLAGGGEFVTLFAFIGGLSAATAMVIVASVALSIMVCNDLVVPMLLRRQLGMAERADMGQLLITIRRVSIFAILLLAFAYYRMVGNAFALASIGLISFAAVAQFAPAFFGGMVWRRASEKGAMAGILSGFAVWTYTLLIPSFINSGWFDRSLLDSGPFAIGFLRPQVLFGLEADPLTHGVLFSLASNLAAYVAVSLMTRRRPVERLQADLFASENFQLGTTGFLLSQINVPVGELRATAERYLGAQRAARSFAEFAESRGMTLDDDADADMRLLRFTERLIASAVGNASARLVVALLLERQALSPRGALRLLDDASAAIQYNRDLLQSAIDNVGQGISVFDENMRLVCWNRQFRDLLDLPPEIAEIGVPLASVLRRVAERGGFGPGDADDQVNERVRRLIGTMETYHERLMPSGRVLEVRTNQIPGGGIVTTYNDITERENATAALARANETLERRVRERTAALTALNQELALAKAAAEEANLGKTRFLAAASHDLLQPLNAARLYTTSLIERRQSGENARLVDNINASLEAVEDILGALLDISRLDAGALKPEITSVDLGDLFKQLEVEFAPAARASGITLDVAPSRAIIRSDRKMLRRVLQNLVSNAIKYTESGKVLVGCRRAGNDLRIEVHDTGPGIPYSLQKKIFAEFERLDQSAAKVRGVGLGLSIVERIAGVLGHRLGLYSEPGKGSVFTLTVPRAEQSVGEAAPRRPAKAAASLLNGMVVLVIDNDRQILDGMVSLLTNWGCVVSIAANAAEAMAVVGFADRPPDIILADYHLDRGTGLDAIAELRTKFDDGLAAILVTADRSGTIKRLAGEARVPVLNKPVKPAALRALMSQVGVARIAAE